ncbi:hypothetical protein [Rothia sp. (in: high G+C Gram-positive bacteria)]|uniref:hypothetical protein n=1 Tax=Rothia sp. (in: high G+C Gram-positive bacteria) TaxID=1885016 RepID=UPI0032165A7D
MADKGHIGLGLATPSKRYEARRTPSDIKVVNKFIYSRRAVVEQVIAQVNTRRVLPTGFRRLLGSCAQVFGVVRGLVFYAAGGTFE